MTVQRKRHIAKALSYRLFGSVQTVIIGYVLTGSVYISSIVGGVELIVKPVLYYMHERIWYRWIKFGLINKDKE